MLPVGVHLLICVDALSCVPCREELLMRGLRDHAAEELVPYGALPRRLDKHRGAHLVLPPRHVGLEELVDVALVLVHCELVDDDRAQQHFDGGADGREHGRRYPALHSVGLVVAVPYSPDRDKHCEETIDVLVHAVLLLRVVALQQKEHEGARHGDQQVGRQQRRRRVLEHVQLQRVEDIDLVVDVPHRCARRNNLLALSVDGRRVVHEAKHDIHPQEDAQLQRRVHDARRVLLAEHLARWEVVVGQPRVRHHRVDADLQHELPQQVRAVEGARRRRLHVERRRRRVHDDLRPLLDLQLVQDAVVVDDDHLDGDGGDEGQPIHRVHSVAVLCDAVLHEGHVRCVGGVVLCTLHGRHPPRDGVVPRAQEDHLAAAPLRRERDGLRLVRLVDHVPREERPQDGEHQPDEGERADDLVAQEDLAVQVGAQQCERDLAEGKRRGVALTGRGFCVVGRYYFLLWSVFDNRVPVSPNFVIRVRSRYYHTLIRGDIVARERWLYLWLEEVVRWWQIMGSCCHCPQRWLGPSPRCNVPQRSMTHRQGEEGRPPTDVDIIIMIMSIIIIVNVIMHWLRSV
eukprot:PhM_4_TR2484/c0_g1_i1/m.33939